MRIQGLTIPKLPVFLMPMPIAKPGEDIGKYMRLALIAAMLSVCFERIQEHYSPITSYWLASVALACATALTLAGTWTEKYSRIAIAVFSVFFVYDAFATWAEQANHSWLAVWTIPVAVLFAKWWEEPLYADYLRVTLGIVMLAAAAQKLLAGTYLDGSYIAFLSYHGSTTENMFQFLCTRETLYNPCGWHKFLGTFILLWQIGVGVLLLVGFRSVLFLTIEVGFLLGAGVYADEMNFQVLNIALLCIAFRVGMSYALFVICGALLLIDLQSIGGLLQHVL